MSTYRCRGAHVKNLFRATQLIAIILLLGAATVAALLSFYLGTRSIDGAHDSVTFISATGIVLDKISMWATSPNALSNRDQSIITNYGTAIIFLISLLAIIVSSLSVIARLNSVTEILPYEKYDLNPFTRLTYRFFLLFRRFSGMHQYWERKRIVAYKKLSVMKMVHYYETADRLLIISGDYSWLFETKWSSQAQQQILGRLPKDACLISYRTPSEVAENWKRFPAYRSMRDIFSALSFVSTANEYNGSIVKEGASTSYIYLFREAHKSARRSAVCAFHAVREATTLVKIVEDDLLRLHNAGLKDSAAESEKERLLSDPSYFG